MKSTQIFSTFISLTETEESSVCGGESVVYSSNTVIYSKGKSSWKKTQVKKQTVKSAKKVLKTAKIGKIAELGILKRLSSLLDFDW
ncbi:MAG: hypothetical protein KME50_10280 [Nostoc desertorum CM1-VF14]|nr:hypothetical protein [Nostoc desertorum CM1-VF14]